MEVYIENIGPISKSNIKIYPLTIFVGSAGKSYTALTIKAMHAIMTEYLSMVMSTILSEMATSRKRKKEDIITKNISKYIYAYTLISLQSSLGQSLPLYLKKEKLSEVVKKGSNDAKIKASFGPMMIDINIRYPRFLEINDMKFDDKLVQAFTEYVKSAYAKTEKNIKRMKLKGVEFSPIEISWSATDLERTFFAVHYLPESRASILEFLRIFSNVTDPDLTYPFVKDFIEKLSLSEKENEDAFSNIAEKIEGLLGGKIEVTNSDKGEYIINYVTKNEKKISIEQATSTVRSLAPLILFLRNSVKKGDVLIIDQPEVHLSSDLVKSMANILVDIVANGVSVIITTKSKLLISTLKDIIQRGGQIDPNNIAGYLFHEEGEVEHLKNFENIEINLI